MSWSTLFAAVVGVAAGWMIGAVKFSQEVDRLEEELVDLYHTLEDVASKIE